MRYFTLKSNVINVHSLTASQENLTFHLFKDLPKNHYPFSHSSTYFKQTNWLKCYHKSCQAMFTLSLITFLSSQRKACPFEKNPMRFENIRNQSNLPFHFIWRQKIQSFTLHHLPQLRQNLQVGFPF